MDSEDSYWEKSDVKALNFDDDESVVPQMCGVSLGGTARLSQQINAGLGSISLDINTIYDSDETTSKFDLHKLVPMSTLDILLKSDNLDLSNYDTYENKDEELQILRRQAQRRWAPPEIESLLPKILTGQPYSFELFRSLSSKKELLRNIISLGDGDAILMVVIFLSQTLKKTLFYQILLTSPVAADHYVTFLSTKMQIQEVTDLLVMLGRSRESAMKHFEFACSNPQRQLQRLKVCARSHFNDMKEKLIVENATRLLEWEESVGKPVGESVAACLEYACKTNADFKGPATYNVLAQEQGVSDRLFQWVAFNAKASAGLWSQIDGLFISKGWLGNKRKKTELPMDVVVMKLYELKAPNIVLCSYLGLIDNVEKRLEVAKRVQCHQAVIKVYTEQRDRLAVLRYRANLQPQSEEFIYSEEVLKNPSIKWKN